jgi:hypothetical protein
MRSKRRMLGLLISAAIKKMLAGAKVEPTLAKVKATLAKVEPTLAKGVQTTLNPELRPYYGVKDRATKTEDKIKMELLNGTSVALQVKMILTLDRLMKEAGQCC